MSSFLFQNNIQLTFLGMHVCLHAGHASMLTWKVPQTIVLTIAVEVLGMLHNTLLPLHCIQVDIERLLLSVAVK